MNVGRTAPGIVFERLIHGLSKIHTVDVLTSDFDPSIELTDLRELFKLKKKALDPRINKLLFSILGIYPTDLLWANKANSDINELRRLKYDLIFSFIAFNHYSPLMAGNKIAKASDTRHFAYAVDAIPAPIGWLKNDLFYKRTKGFIAKYLSRVDGFFSANTKMLKYQLTVFKPKEKFVSGVIYNPSYGEIQNYPSTQNKVHTFLYTGGIYGPRKAHYLLKAFKAILAEHPNSSLEFVGCKIPDESLLIFTPEEKDKVVFHPFARDLSPYYERCTALLDIDADLPDDVFLSSKIINYIKINKIIISETGNNSPSRELFKNIPSIIQCNHNVDEITRAMLKAIQAQDTINFDDRSKIRAIFDLDSVIRGINNLINNDR
jgi:hypothetical protein